MLLAIPMSKVSGFATPRFPSRPRQQCLARAWDIALIPAIPRHARRPSYEVQSTASYAEEQGSFAREPAFASGSFACRTGACADGTAGGLTAFAGPKRRTMGVGRTISS